MSYLSHFANFQSKNRLFKKIEKENKIEKQNVFLFF